MNKKLNKNNNSIGGFCFDTFNYIFLIFISLTCILPFLYIIAGSFASDIEFRTKAFFIIPEHFTIRSYVFIFSSDRFLRSIFVSIFITVVGTLVNLLFTLSMAYPLARKNLMGRNLILNLVIFSMIFSGGMVPHYLVVRGLHMLNTYWSLIIPGAISVGNLIIIKTFFQDLPQGLEEAASIDGCTDLQVLIRIVLPLSMPVIATFGLFYAVGHWNSFFNALLFINDMKKWPLQVLLRQIIMLSQGTIGDVSNLDSSYADIPQDGVKMAVIVLGTVPILMVYPFLQKHFAKGVMIGAIKG